MTKDIEEHIIPDQRNRDAAIYPSATMMIVVGLIAGACTVLAAEFWLQRHIRPDSFVILSVFIASWVTRDRLGLATFTVVWLPLASFAFLCGIASYYAAENLHCPTAALIAIGGLSGGLIAVVAVTYRFFLTKRSESKDEVNAWLQ